MCLCTNVPTILQLLYLLSLLTYNMFKDVMLFEIILSRW